MKRILPLRVYTVAPSEFPITVRIEAKGMQVFQAVVSTATITTLDAVSAAQVHVPIEAWGREESSIETRQPDGEPLVREFRFLPVQAPSDITFTVDGYFASADADDNSNAKYILSLESVTGQVERTVMRKARRDSRTAHVKLEVRS